MGFEDREDATGATALTRYGLGARGVDLIERTPDNGTPTVGFPLYDAHGNNMATLTRSGTNGYQVSDRRSYDAWGQVRAQQSGGDPTLRYCASLGHKQDDETGLVYMRARYYEPGSGRFLSEDPNIQGRNWFVHCGNDPVNRSDRDGRTYAQAGVTFLTALFFLASGWVMLNGGGDMTVGGKGLKTLEAEMENFKGTEAEAWDYAQNLKSEIVKLKATRAKNVVGAGLMGVGAALVAVAGYMAAVAGMEQDEKLATDDSGLDALETFSELFP